MRLSTGLLSLLLVGCKTIYSEAEGPRIRVVDTLNCNKLVHYVKPVYPREALRRRVQGTAKLRMLITKTGEPRDFEVLQGDPLLAPAALKAAKQWRYTPCSIGSGAVDVKAILDVNFTLSQ